MFLECRVTRLIKASKQQKPTREALISGTGSASSLVFGEGSSKLNVAQSELQACETHLANKERELEVLRLSTIRVGLHARCTAMVNCGWTWGEMGKEGLRALESLDIMTNGHCELQSLIQFRPYLNPWPSFSPAFTKVPCRFQTSTRSRRCTLGPLVHSPFSFRVTDRLCASTRAI